MLRLGQTAADSQEVSTAQLSWQQGTAQGGCSSGPGGYLGIKQALLRDAIAGSSQI